MNESFFIYMDENDFRKKKRALARYFKKCHKYLIFEAMPKLKQKGKKDGVYEVELPAPKLFVKVYGKILLKFSVKNDIAILEDITPNDILLACYSKDLPTYKGIPYDTKKDLEKIKIMEVLCKKKS